MNLDSLIQSLHLKQGQTHRQDCPFCRGKNTFTITKSDGAYLWNCYRVSCKRAGATPYKRGQNEVRESLGKSDIGHSGVSNFVLPSYWSGISSHEGCIKLLAKYNCLDAYYDRAIDCRYDPKLNRLVFLIKDEQGVIQDAVGRSLEYFRSPKWCRYWDWPGYFACLADRRISIICEDCFSAIAGYRVGLTGVALLGTHLANPAWFGRYSKIYLCLDPDAARHSLKLARKLSPYTDVRVRFLTDDPKHLANEQLREQLKLD